MNPRTLLLAGTAAAYVSLLPLAWALADLTVAPATWTAAAYLGLAGLALQLGAGAWALVRRPR